MSKPIALITGAAGNLGKAMAHRYLEGGYQVIGTMLHVEPRQKIEDHEDCTRVSVDLTDEKAVLSMIADIESQGKSIEVGVFTVGGFAMGNLENTDQAALSKMMVLNFHTAYHSARSLFLHMKKHGKGGRIVLTSSRQGLHPKIGGATLGYTLSKSLIPALADIINAEGKAHNITATVLVPSTIDTPQNRNAMPDSDFTKWVTPDAIAEVVFFTTTGKGNPLRETVLKVYGQS
ncbi:MAG: SDR family NAD(P)-dependent oxidoreductase [Bacteroidota bacterium]